ncbi:MAG: hypothetical protein ABI665_12155 [Vicinamibacterales bacterium]
MRFKNWCWTAAAAIIVAGLTAAAFAQAGQMPTIEHVLPARDSVGPAPQRFEWTAVKGADSYAIGVWSEVDVLWWRADNISTNSVAWGGERPLEPGTYFWSVTAVRGDRAIADSGLAGFVVRQP